MTTGLYLLVNYRYKYLLSIRSVTIKLQKPELKDGHMVRRVENGKLTWLIAAEEKLRRVAYKTTTINTGDSFFNDADMTGPYYLVLVYHRKTKTPLLSARYYFDKAVIKQYAEGDGDSRIIKVESESEFTTENYKQGELFLADRLSGNIGHTLYRQYRQYIFLLFYAQVYARNRHSRFILMARKERGDKLLHKYLALGLKLIGTRPHNGISHYVLLGDLKQGYTSLKLRGFFAAVMALKTRVIKLQKL